MTRHALAGVLLTALLAGPAAAAEKNSPKLTQEAKDGAQITQENIVKMKLRQSTADDAADPKCRNCHRRHPHPPTDLN